MSKYGIDYYGASYYGATTLVEFNAAPFTAKPYGYSKILLNWTTPSGAWDYLRLVRNPIGFPVAADDGDILFEDANATSRTSYFDEGQTPNNIGLKESVAYYYTLFVRETTYSTWKIAGLAIGVSVKNFNTGNNMYNYLPIILTSQVPYDTSVEQDNDVIKRFLNLFALNHDLYKTQAENVLNLYDVSNLNGALVPVFMKQFGLKYEPELGLRQSRILLRNIMTLYKNKGSKLGIEEYVKAYAGYDNTVTQGKNLMLDKNDSSFEETIGSWASVSNATLLKLSVNQDSAVPGYSEVLSQTNFPNLQKGILKVTATTSATVEIALNGTTARQYGIPVKAGSSYTVTGYSRANSATRSVSAAIAWYTRTGSLISTSTFGTGVTNSTTEWKRSVKTATAPATAYYAVPHFKITGASSSEIHYFDAIQFELGSSATYFQDARQIIINLKATRINELLNPNFEGSTTYWNATNANLSIITDVAGLPQNSSVTTLSNGAAESTSLATGNVRISSDPVAVLAGNDYTFSIYVATSQTGVTRPLTPFIKWYNSSNVLISTVNGTQTGVTNLFVRPFVTAAAPVGATTAVVGVNWTATAAGNKITLDSALFEKSSFVNSFFDGSHGVASLTDLFWQGDVANAGRSHYYRNRFAVQSRLIATLPDWITYGSTFELLFAQPD